MNYDEHIYPDPFTFNLDRLITGGTLDPFVRDFEAAFGYGRRGVSGASDLSCLLYYLSLLNSNFQSRPAYGARGHLVKYSLNSNIL